MINKRIILICILSGIIIKGIAQSDTYLKLWYLHPAKQWVEALPVGNGRLGAMVFGNNGSAGIREYCFFIAN
jgi:alpha-L-fucosidase 2